MHFGIIVMTIATACVYSNAVVAAAVPSFPQVNEDTVIQSADAAVEILNNNGFLRGLKSYEGGAGVEEERVFIFDKLRAVLSNREKVAKAKKLLANHASISRIVEEGITPTQLFKALGLKALGSNGKMKYDEYKALSGEELASVARMIRADDTLGAKTQRLLVFEQAYAKAQQKLKFKNIVRTSGVGGAV